MQISARAARIAGVLLVVGVAAVGAVAQSPKPKLPSIQPKVACAAMVGHEVPAARIGLPTKGATIKAAELKPASGQPGSPDYLPEYCGITGVIHPVDPAAPDINFGVNIPTAWNQKAWHVGGQGFNGIIPVNLASVARYGQDGFRAGSPLNATYPPNAPTPLGSGYATFGGDSGHSLDAPVPGAPAAPANAGRAGGAAPANGGGGGRAAGGPAPDPAPMPEWMWNDEAWTNLAYAGLKKTHDAGLEVIKMMYGSAPRVTYFGGQSHGGREALTVANMFPQDYDGVIVAGPLAYWASWVTFEGFRVKEQIAPGRWMPPAKGVAVRDEVLRQCDGLDGLVDRVIQNYTACDRLFDPSITPNPLARIRCADGKDTGNDCLSDGQIETVNWWHAPHKYGYTLVNGDTEWPGWPTGGEGATGWLLSQTQPTTTSQGGRPNFLSGGLRDKTLTNGIKVDLATHKDKIIAMSKTMDARNDWSKLLAKGGKLIFYTGGADYLISSRAQARVFTDALKKSSPAAFERGVRYYVGPGLGHGGNGTDANGKQLPNFVDLVSVLENWVENSVTPPDPLVQSVMDPHPPFTVTRSRPLCRYPQYPHYNGSGDANLAASYTCKSPNAAAVANSN